MYPVRLLTYVLGLWLDVAIAGFGGMTGAVEGVLLGVAGRAGKDGTVLDGRAGSDGATPEGLSLGNVCDPVFIEAVCCILVLGEDAAFSAAQSDSANTSRAVLFSVCMKERTPDPYPFGPHLRL